MKVTLAQIYQNWLAIGEIAQVKLPAARAFKLARFVREAQPHFDDVEKQRVTLVEKYGVPDTKGNLTVEPEKMANFMTEFNELLGVEVEVSNPGLTLTALGDAPVSALTLNALDWLVTDDTDSK